MTRRQNVPSGTRWEEIVGYSRAVRLGNTVEVAGTTAVDETGAVVGTGDPYQQTRFVLAKIEQVLAQVGASLDDVIRTRMYVTDIGHWEAIGRAHGEAFGAIRPAATMVEVKALIDERLLVEVEATAMLSGSES
jgi:enamine deaminase RidA (YjgF/YER057c/UK114 family)